MLVFGVLKHLLLFIRSCVYPSDRYIGAINSGAVPAIATAWENVTSAECSRVANEVETAIYAAKFAQAAESCPPEELPLMTAHAEALKQAVAVFERQAVCPIILHDHCAGCIIFS